jgi:hypothetical protein
MSLGYFSQMQLAKDHIQRQALKKFEKVDIVLENYENHKKLMSYNLKKFKKINLSLPLRKSLIYI